MNDFDNPIQCRGSTLRRQPRDGTLLICVMTCLLIVTSLLTGALQKGLHSRALLKQERTLRQVEQLIDSGWNRARWKLTIDDTYTGERWRLPPGSFGDARIGAEVVIQVEPPNVDAKVVVRVAAEFPSDTARSIRRTQYFSIPQSLSQ